MKKETEEKRSEKGYLNKTIAACCAILALNLFFRPQIVLANIKEFHLLLSNIYTMLVNFSLGFCISFLFRFRLKNLTGLIGVVLSCLFGIFLEINFEKSFVESNLAVILLCSGGLLCTVCLILFSDQIRRFLSNRKRIFTILVTIAVCCISITTVTAYIIFTVKYFQFYGWHWTNIVI